MITVGGLTRQSGVAGTCTIGGPVVVVVVVDKVTTIGTTPP